MTVLAAGLALSACAASPPSAGGPGIASAPAPSSVGRRDLTPEEKKKIVEAVALSLKDPASAKYRWAKFPTDTPPNGSVNYCGTVDAKSPYPAYNGRQVYIVEANVVGGRVSSATMGLIAGGKDAAIVSTMCAKYGLDPNNAT